MANILYKVRIKRSSDKMIIKGVNEDVKGLVEYCEGERIEVDKEQVKAWITDIIEDIEPKDMAIVVDHLLNVEHTKENLLEVYSFVNECFERKHGNKSGF